MKHKQHIKKHVSDLIAKTGFKKLYIAEQIGLKPDQLSQIINGHREKIDHREAVFCFLRHYIPEVRQYRDVWLEDRPGTINFKTAV